MLGPRASTFSTKSAYGRSQFSLFDDGSAATLIKVGKKEAIKTKFETALIGDRALIISTKTQYGRSQLSLQDPPIGTALTKAQGKRDLRKPKFESFQLGNRASVASNRSLYWRSQLHLFGDPSGAAFKVVKRDANKIKYERRLRRMGWSDTDLKDLSYNPSYAKYEIPYYVLCLIRYREARRNYEKQFRWEIEHLMEQQATAYDETLLARPFHITSLWPPLHSRREMDHTHRRIFKLSAKQRNRLTTLLTTKVL